MDVLIDYYNLSQQHRRMGIVHVVDRIVSAIVPDHITDGDSRIELRLYGGWYEGQKLTRSAEAISATLIDSYPMTVSSGVGQRSIIVRVELARSMKCDPAHHLWYTLRPKAAPRGIEFVSPAEAGCGVVDRCPIRPGYDFFVRGHCPEPACEVTRPLVIRRREQKLVDTMLAADVFFNAHFDARRIAVVSSDDDLWPAIRTALHFGLAVVHVHTEESYETKQQYLPTERAGYTQINLHNGTA